MVLTRREEISEAFLGKEATHEVRVEGEFWFEGDFLETLTKAKFKRPNTNLFKKILKPIPKVLEDNDLTKKEIGEIVPVGVATRSPKVQT